MLPLLPLRLHYTASTPLPVPRYSGGAWRSGFGMRLRELACITGAPTCTGCPVQQQCAYGQVFETSTPTNARGLNARHQEQPHPYVLSPQGESHTEAVVDFTLLPTATAHLPLLLRALKTMQPSKKLRGEWQLQAIQQRSLMPGSGSPIWQIGQPWPSATAQTPACPPAPPAVRIHIEQLLRLRVPVAQRRNPEADEYVAAKQFTFELFFTALLRRIEMLHGLSSATPLADDLTALVQHAKTLTPQAVQLQWHDWARYSARQKRLIPMGGLQGSFELHGDLAPLWPWLHIGQWLHVGKGAVMGLGRYRLESLA
jgi:hypothetical protein